MASNEFESESLSEHSLSERVTDDIIETAGRVRDSIMTEMQALAEVFPQIEVAAEATVTDRQEIGAIALGLSYRPTDLIPGIILEDTDKRYAPRYSAIVLTPYSLEEAFGSNTTDGRVVPTLVNRQPNPEREALLWLTYGSKAAKAVEHLKSQKQESAA